MSCGVKVAVDNAAFKFDKLYSYDVPNSLSQFARVGARVLVPFGKAAPRMGVVLELFSETVAGLKEIIDIEKGDPLLDNEQVRLILFLRETTFCTYYDAVKTVLPKNARLVPNGKGEGIVASSEAHLETVFVYREPSVSPRLTEKQRAVCDAIKECPMSFSEIAQRVSVGRDVVTRLVEKGIIERENRNKEANIYAQYTETAEIPLLTAAQGAALKEIEAGYLDEKKPSTTLLNGVTSSGKTLIYIRLIEQVISDGKSAMLLVPEIAIATQMIYRLKSLFGERVGIIHSALNDTERYLQWLRIKSGECSVVVGTRSAVFSPARSLGLIIVDEEQETSYRSEKNPRYDAVAVARFRARETGARLLLASATPSVESYFAAKSGKYNLVELDERYGNMPLPKVRVVDMRSELLAGNSHYVSKYLCDEIEKRLAKNEQCILLLNRRGYRTISMCRSCKKIVKCESCDTPLVLHKSSLTHVCHYCGRAYSIREICDECGGAIMHTGIGTQKIEEELENFFPNARILRLDLDSVSKKHSIEKLLYDFSKGEYDIIIGTQMIAKGLDFKNVTLAGVLSIDQLLLMPSFKANERTFSMLTQVIGRSGRGDKTGEAIIQTVDPDNAIIKLAARQDYRSFYKDEIVSRKLHLYPPYCSLCTIGFVSRSEKEAAASAESFLTIMKMVGAKQQYSRMPIKALGPAPMRVAFVNDLYRQRIVIKCKNNTLFRSFLRECMNEWNKQKINEKGKLFVDFGDELDG